MENKIMNLSLSEELKSKAPDTRQLLLIIVSFSGRESLEPLLPFSVRRLERYCEARQIETFIY